MVLRSMIKKEALHIVRDPRTMLIVLIMPVVLLLLFGFAISTEVNDVRVVAVVERHDDGSRLLMSRLEADPYFTFCGTAGPEEIEPLLRRGKADAAVIQKCSGAGTAWQVIVDASNTNTAQTAAGYLESVIGGKWRSPVVTHTMYNPLLKSSYNFVPGIMGMIFILICAMMTSVSIVSEKETGTMNLLLVSPARPRTVILGKMVPYFVLSCVILALMLVIVYTVLELPFSYAVFNVVWVSVLYIVLALALGLLISTVAATQVTALLVSGVLLMLPVIMLSGMIFPVENMPAVLQWVSCLIPARWYISAMRTLMIQQLPVSYVMTDVAVLAGMTAAVLIPAVRKFNTKH